MKTILKTVFLSVIMVTMLSITSCKMSTSDIAEEVKISMVETWEKEGITGVTIESLILTHKSGNEYSGILETNEDGEAFKYTVEVIYDGENLKWEVVE